MMFRNSEFMKTVAASLIVLATTLPAHAILIEVPGENYSYDASTSLRWLDLTETAGLSFNDVISGTSNSWLALGWHYATAGDIKYLFETNLPSLVTSSSTEGDPQPGDFYANWQPDSSGEVRRLIDILGNTNAYLNSPELGATGIYDRLITRTSCCDPGQTAHNLAALISSGNQTDFLVTMQGGAQDQYRHTYVGSFLVSTVPEPTSSWLYVVGLTLLGIRAAGEGKVKLMAKRRL